MGIRNTALATLVVCAGAWAQTTLRVGWITPDGVRVERIAVEDYVEYALNGEVGVFRSDAALDAMAIVIRTYARVNAGRHSAQGFDVCSNTHCQRLLRERVPEKVKAAAARTRAQMLWAHGRPADVYFHRNCGGRTEDAEAVWPGAGRAWLVSAVDEACARNDGHPWTATVELSELARAVGVRGLRVLRVETRTASGRVRTLMSDAGVLDGERVHLGVGRTLGWGLLKSRYYDVHVEGTRAVFAGRGMGHGVGLCQDGAERRGIAGHSVEAILGHYFPGTRIGVSARGFDWQQTRGERVILRAEALHAELLTRCVRALHDAENRLGWPASTDITVEEYPSVAAYRDATGEAGFVAASTRGGTVRLQPYSTLAKRGGLDAVLLHELMHALIHQRARTELPRWFEEGVVSVLADERVASTSATASMDAPRNERELRVAYAQAAARVRRLMERYGRATVLSWVERGVPAEVG